MLRARGMASWRRPLLPAPSLADTCVSARWPVFSALARGSRALDAHNGRSQVELARPALSAAHAAEHSSALHLSLRAECALQFAFQVTRRGRRQAAACGCGSRRPHAAGAAAGGLPRPAWRDAGRAEPHPPLQGARHLHRQLRCRLVGLLGLAGSGEGYGWGQGEGKGESEGQPSCQAVALQSPSSSCSAQKSSQRAASSRKAAPSSRSSAAHAASSAAAAAPA